MSTMSSDRIRDYLTRQIFVHRNIVTYRSLSRDLSLHVNTAKNELASFYAACAKDSQTAFATYLVSGEALPQSISQRENYNMDVDEDYENMEDEDGELVLQWKVLLVGEEKLEASKAEFTTIASIYIHSLSPARLIDPDLLSLPLEIVRKFDTSSRNASSSTAASLGRLVGTHVQLGKPRGLSLKKSPTPQSTTFAKVDEVPGNERKETEESAAKSKPKPTGKTFYAAQQPANKANETKQKQAGKLDFSKSKTRGTKDKEKKVKEEAEDVTDAVKTFKGTSKASASKQVTKHVEKPKALETTDDDTSRPASRASSVCTSASEFDKPMRGTKRKSVSDSEEAKSSSKSGSSKSKSKLKGFSSRSVVHRGAIVSDEDEDSDGPPPPPPPRRKRKASAGFMSLDVHDDLRAMMDVDDDQVERVTRAVPVVYQKEEEEEEEEMPPLPTQDSKMDEQSQPEEDMPPKRVPKKRVKKIVPIGLNGLKKRRVVKSRVKENEKGYQVTEDYSSYESVDEEEEEEIKPKPKTSKKAEKKVGRNTAEGDKKPTAAAADSDSGAPKRPKAKGKTGPKPVQKSQSKLNNFFAPPKTKK